MKVKVREASGVMLDWLVAKCEGSVTVRMFENSKGFRVYKNESMKQQGIPFAPSTDWSQGGPILTREHISRTIDHSGLWIAYWTDGYTDGDEGNKWMQCDRSELVAGLRCYVTSKLGEEVEVPDELA